MTKNYFLFARQTRLLSQLIEGQTVRSIFTENKDELTLLLDSENGPVRLLIGINKVQPYIILKNSASKNNRRYNFFPSAWGEKINKLSCVSGNKHIIISIGPYELQAVFYGPAANIYFFNEESLPDVFKSHKKIFAPQRALHLNKPDADCLSDLLKTDSQHPVVTFLKEKCPPLNKLMVNEILCRAGFSTQSVIGNKPGLLFDVFKNFYDELLNGPAYLYKHFEKPFHLTLFKSCYLENEDYQAELFQDINKAWDIFISKEKYQREYARLSARINLALKKSRSKLEFSLEKIRDAEDITKYKKIADLKGNLLLTNLHKIPRGSKFIELKNIIDGNDEQIEIKLNPAKSIAENANIYFNKYKNKTKKLEILELKKNHYVKELNIIAKMEQQSATTSIKTLHKIEEKLIAMHILAKNENSSVTPSELKFSFKRLIIENQWDIYIGKNNINNDLLTFSFAHKWDIWLHAQGVSGSHVIIRRPNKNMAVPASVLRKAARITAANSKARHSGSVPVIYTEARYVTRIRKALPGTVNVRNEKVLFVEPLNMNI